MKKIILNTVWLFATLLFVASCEDSNSEPNLTQLPKGLEQKSATLITSGNDFGIDVFKQIAVASTDTNTMISPVSIATALAMTYNGADGETKQAMEETLSLSGYTTEEINLIYQNLLNTLSTADEKVVLKVANSIWSKEGFPFHQSFYDVNKTYYNAETQTLDFSNPATLGIINGWIEDNTNGLIKDMIDEIPGDAVMYLINAIYFKAQWHYSFDEKETKEATFTLANGTTKQVQTMVQKANYEHLSNELFESVKLPYGNGDFNMLVFLPKYDKTAENIAEELNATNWNKWQSQYQLKNDIQLYFPKFKFEYKKELKDILKLMGMGVAFGGNADFSKMTSTKVYITRVLHNTMIEVSEEGTEAAAATVVEMGYKTISDTPQPYPFRVNRPFIFAITEKESNSILFIGKVVDPTIQ